MKRVAIVQSNYIPWRGYFDLIGLVDEFVLYDIVQFTKRDWRNRNRIKTASGLLWLTIPVATAGAYHQAIHEVRISDAQWADRHWRSICHAYAHAPFFAACRERWQARYDACAALTSLSDVNRFLIEAVAQDLGVSTTISLAPPDLTSSDRTGRLVEICRARGATTYLSGPSARSYMDIAQFTAAGIEVEYMDYSAYRPYPQLHGAFEPAVSIVDLLFNAGPDAKTHMLCAQPVRS